MLHEPGWAIDRAVDWLQFIKEAAKVLFLRFLRDLTRLFVLKVDDVFKVPVAGNLKGGVPRGPP